MQMSLRIVSAACIVAAALVTPGCGKKLSNTLGLPNQPPTVHLTSAPPVSSGALQVSHRMSWTANDPDGRVDHYLIALNPRSVVRVDASWQSVRDQERTLTLRRATPGALRKDADDGRELTVFAVRAVDDRGAVSDPAYRAMFADNIAPSVRITSPVPNHLITALVRPDIRIRWQGNDPDGSVPSHLAKYKIKLLAEGNPEFPLEVALSDPDSLRRLYAPAFAGWDSVPGDSLAHTFTGLEISHDYLFAITGFDEAGDYDPVFSLDTNMLFLHIAFSSTLGPRITMYNDYFNFGYRSGGFSTDPAVEVPVDAPADEPFTLNWSAQPAPGYFISGYRWSLDIVDVNDETPRHGRNGLAHWSKWDLTTGFASVGPFHGPAADHTHWLYIEAADDLGEISLGIVRLIQVRTTFESDLLIVDDTRLLADQVSLTRRDSIAAPGGGWPTAAELDTFLYARGGVRWRMYPAGTLSGPGLFAGYHYDTLGTRTGRLDPTVPLDVLGRYRHVIWILDPISALYNKNGDDPSRPISALRYMSARNHLNTLAAYASAGGQLWLLGGGAGEGAAISYSKPGRGSDLGPDVFSAARGELVPGTMMYDIVHWRSEFTALRTRPILRSIAPMTMATRSRVDAGDESRELEAEARPSAINYGLLPLSLQMRDPGSDPLPPLRAPNSFYRPPAALEYLSMPNEITEERLPRGRHREAERDHAGRPPRLISVLDSLYRADASIPPGFPSINTCMTLFHGQESGQVIFSGFDIWTWQRTQCLQLVDGVLQGIWGLTRDPVARVAAVPQPAARDPGGR